jgi:hypothetical protein
MPTRPKFFPTSVSRYLDPKERSWDTVVSQKGRLVLDSEKILEQDLVELNRMRELARTLPSGWVRGQSRGDAYDEFSFDVPWLAGPALNPDFVANAFHMQKVQALVAGILLDIEYVNTDTKGDNLIQLDPPTVSDGTPLTHKRTDFVWLEVFLSLVSESPNATGTFLVVDPLAVAPGDTVDVDGITLTAVAALPGANEFLIGANAVDTAMNLASSINTNVATVTAVANANVVQLRAVASGAAGNAIPFSSATAAITASGAGFLSGGVDTPNKPTQDTIYRHGNTDSSSTVALPDDIEDPDVGVETTKRVQVQYRVRTYAGASFNVGSDGFSDTANILAQGTQVAPVANYPFVPADLTSVVNNSDARDGVAGPDIGYGILDNGLWIAGNGTQTAATDLGTIDGFVYAVPLCFVFRKNDATAGIGFNPLENTNGALLHNHGGVANPALFAAVPVAESSRPDGVFADQIVLTDILDLRRHVKFADHDYAAELQYQMQSLQDGQFKTWAIDGAAKQQLGNGSGDVSTQFLAANEIGRTAAVGGLPPLAGDTTRGETIRNFDHVSRRFGDQPVCERVVFTILPTDDIGTNPGKYVTKAGYAAAFNGWAEGDVINIDFSMLNMSTLGDFDPTNLTSWVNPSAVFTALVPPGTTVTDVLSIYHDDGNWNVTVDQTVKPTVISGLGTSQLEITLDMNPTNMTGGISAAPYEVVGTNVTGDVGSPRRIFIELEITYPAGSGLTDTPDVLLSPDTTPWPFGPMVENWRQSGVSQQPTDMENPLAPSFRTGYREVNLEYVANDPTAMGGNLGIPIGTLTTETVVSRDALNLVLPRRAFGDAITSIALVDGDDGNPRETDDPNTEYGSSSRLVVLNNTGIAPAVPLSGAGQTLVEVRYFAQDAIPNFGANGYQQTIYYRSNAPQTCGVKDGALSTSVTAFPYVGAPSALPQELLVEPLYISKNIWSGQRGVGSVDLSIPYAVPLDQIPVNDGTSYAPPSGVAFPGEHYFAASASISLENFTTNTGTLALHSLVPADGTETYTMGGAVATEQPIRDSEFRAVFPVCEEPSGRSPQAQGENLLNGTRHKVFVPVLARSLQDTALFRKDELLLLTISRWAVVDAQNTVEFVNTTGNTGVGVFRTKNLLMTAGNQE